MLRPVNPIYGYAYFTYSGGGEQFIDFFPSRVHGTGRGTLSVLSHKFRSYWLPSCFTLFFNFCSEKPDGTSDTSNYGERLVVIVDFWRRS